MGERKFVVCLFILLIYFMCSPGECTKRDELNHSTTNATVPKDVPKGFQIITVDWLKVHVPYLITFWVLVAFSALIGVSPSPQIFGSPLMKKKSSVGFQRSVD